MTGVSPSELLDDDLLYAACVEEAKRAGWTDVHELLAVNAELTHGVLCQLRASAGAKEHDMPKPLRIRRPNEPKPKTVSVAELAEQLKGGM